MGDRDRGSSDAWTNLAGLAAVTSTIRLGTLVSPVTFREPAVLAKAAVTVDRISGGRVELGIGAGWWEEEHRTHGFPFPPVGERFDRLEEQLEIVHRLLTEDVVHVRRAALPARGRAVRPEGRAASAPADHRGWRRRTTPRGDSSRGGPTSSTR